MSDSLRAEVDRIIDQHFEPSVMGRTLAVDEIIEAVKVAGYKLDLDVSSRTIGVIGTHTFGEMTIHVDAPASPPPAVVAVEDILEMTIHVDAPASPPPAVVVEDILSRAPRPRRMDRW